MQRWVSIHETNCDPIREAEYNEWCDGIHIPDVLTTPGFVRARRFQSKEFRDGRGKYMIHHEARKLASPGSRPVPRRCRAA